MPCRSPADLRRECSLRRAVGYGPRGQTDPRGRTGASGAFLQSRAMADRVAPLSREVLAELVARGLSDAEIAALAGVRPRSLQNRRLKFGLQRPRVPGPEWSAAEDRELTRLFRRGLTDGQIAQRLGRTAPHAIPGRRVTLGLLRLDEQPWSDDENEILREMWETSATVREIGAELGRTIGEVTQRRRRLGLEPRS